MHMVSVLLSEMVRPNAPKTSTKTAIIRPSPRVDRDTMHASSAYSIPQIARRTHSSAVSGPTFDGCSCRWTRSASMSASLLNLSSTMRSIAPKNTLNNSQTPRCRSVRNRSTLLVFLLPTPFSPHCTLRVSEHDSRWRPVAAHSDERPRLPKPSRAQRCLNALTPGYLKGTVARGYPMVWSLALCPDDAKQAPVVYGAKFGFVVFPAKGPVTASIQEGLDCLGL